VQEGFKRAWLSGLAGWLVIGTGVVSAATIATVFTPGFLQDLMPVPEIPVFVGLVIVLGLIASWGISESVWFANIITVITIAGLVYVVIQSGDSLLELPERLFEKFKWP
jgi:APA family basic amino acid/polyamine antiporter